MRYFSAIQWLTHFAVYTFLLGYVATTLVWFILGAIINPNMFLMYATTALTLTTFVASKSKSLSHLAA
jgi:hypothetical protein